MDKSMYLSGVLAALLLAGVAAAVAPAFAEDDEENERGGAFGLGAGEEERGESDDDSGSSVGGLSGLILYGVIAAVLGTIAYTGYKVFVSRKKAVRTNP